MYGLLNALGLALVLTLSHGLLKWFSTKASSGYISALQQYWWAMAAAIFLYVLIFFYYAYVLRNVSISSLYPTYTGLSICFVSLLGIYVFGERFSASQGIGVLLVIIGIFLITIDAYENQ